VLRLVGLFIAFALLFSNGVAVGNAICQHGEAQAHAAALRSLDEQVSSAAKAEEMAEHAASKSGTLADNPLPMIGMLPPTMASDVDILIAAIAAVPSDDPTLADRALAPPLRPPLH
jgi:hypothetical protein